MWITCASPEYSSMSIFMIYIVFVFSKTKLTSNLPENDFVCSYGSLRYLYLTMFNLTFNPGLQQHLVVFIIFGSLLPTHLRCTITTSNPSGRSIVYRGIGGFQVDDVPFFDPFEIWKLQFYRNAIKVEIAPHPGVKCYC